MQAADYTITGAKVGGGAKVHATFILGYRTVRQFGQVTEEPMVGTPFCGASIWTKRGGYGAITPVSAPVNCERCLASPAAR
jgi:hypothetical protein